jgi:hypothetical protein
LEEKITAIIWMRTKFNFQMKNTLLALTLLLILTSCLALPDADGLNRTPTTFPTEIQSQSSTPKTVESPNIEGIIKSLEGPLLLIHDNSSAENPLFLLDISTAKQYPLDIPVKTSITSLGNALSPDKHLMVLVKKFSDDPFKKDLLILDILTGQIIHEIHVQVLSPLNLKEMFSQFPDDVKREFLERNLGDWILNESLAGSLGMFRWSKDSRFLYYSNSCEGGYSCLYRYDLSTKQVSQMEREIYFIEGIYPSPDESSILMIKSPIPQLTDFPIANVIVIDPSLAVTPIPPISSDLDLTYEYSWLDANSLLIAGFNVEDFNYSEIYQFSLNRKEFLLITNEPFSDFIISGIGIFTMKFDQVTQSTIVIVGSEGQQNKFFNIPGECSDLIRSSIPGYKIIASCEQGLFGFDPSYVLNKITDNSGNFVLSPDLRFSIQYGSSDPSDGKDSIKLLDTNYNLLSEMVVSDVRQIIWQPDSQGFLYLSLQGLFNVKLPDGEPELLIQNNTDDYRHLDAVWFDTNPSY